MDTWNYVHWLGMFYRFYALHMYITETAWWTLSCLMQTHPPNSCSCTFIHNKNLFVLFTAIPATEPPPTSQCGKMEALIAGIATPPGFTCNVFPDCLGFHCFGSINAIILVSYFLLHMKPNSVWKVLLISPCSLGFVSFVYIVNTLCIISVQN